MITKMSGMIRIVAWNANGLSGVKKMELIHFLDYYQVDVCLISETHFTEESYLKMKGYDSYHTTHPSDKARGGAAILVRSGLDHHQDLSWREESIQAVTIVLKTRIGQIKVSSIYSPPRHILKKHNYSSFLATLGSRFIVGGDWNAKHVKWGSRLTLTKGRELNAAVQALNGDFISSGRPTYWPTDKEKKPDLVDFFVTKNIPMNSVEIELSEIPKELSSDHSPISFSLGMEAIKKCRMVGLTNAKTDWEKFRKDLNDRIRVNTPITDKAKLELEAELIVTQIQEAAKKNTPLIKTTKLAPKISLEIRSLIADKRRARGKWQKTRSEMNKAELNRLTNKLTTEMWKIKNSKTEEFLKTVTAKKDTDYALWKATKYLKRTITHSPPIKDSKGDWAKSEADKAEVFREHLESIFKPKVDEERERRMLHEIVDLDPNDPLEIRSISQTELVDLIRYKVKNKKAPGMDMITGEILKQLPGKAAAKLVKIFNAALTLCYVPKNWKVAEVIVIPKAGKPLDLASSYRPISLLSTIGKLFERLYLKRLVPLIEEKKIIPDHQFGFRASHSTIEQVHRFTDQIERGLEEKQVCSAVFLDVAQAFDRVWHLGLLYKIKKLLPENHYGILKSYLECRSFRVRFNGTFSDFSLIRAGVPQGSVLGPYLYNLFTHDIPCDSNSLIGTFADDTGVASLGQTLAEANAKTQFTVNNIGRWAWKWGTTLNNIKSAHTIFTNRKVGYQPIYLDGEIIPYSNVSRYLGLHLDSKLNWREHIRKKAKEIGIKVKKMNWLLGRNSRLQIHNKVLLYKQIVRPVWAYGCQLWGCSKNSNIRIIQTLQNKILRQILGAPWYMRNEDIRKELGIPTVKEYIREVAEKYEVRVMNHVNEEAVMLMDNNYVIRRLNRRKPFELPCRCYDDET